MIVIENQPPLLADRHKQARVVAAAAVAASARLMASSNSIMLRSIRLRREARDLMRVPPPIHYDKTWFSVRGLVDGRPTIARWSPAGLECEREISRRAELIVALGDEFTHDDARMSIPASLDGPPFAVLLTVMRAFSLVTAVDVSCDLLRVN